MISLPVQPAEGEETGYFSDPESEDTEIAALLQRYIDQTEDEKIQAYLQIVAKQLADPEKAETVRKVIEQIKDPDIKAVLENFAAGKPPEPYLMDRFVAKHKDGTALKAFKQVGLLIEDWFRAAGEAVGGLPHQWDLATTATPEVVGGYNAQASDDAREKYDALMAAKDEHGEDSEQFKTARAEYVKLIQSAAPTLYAIHKDMIDRWSNPEKRKEAWENRPWDLISDVAFLASLGKKAGKFGKIASALEKIDPGSVPGHLVSVPFRKKPERVDIDTGGETFTTTAEELVKKYGDPEYPIHSAPAATLGRMTKREAKILAGPDSVAKRRLEER